MMMYGKTNNPNVEEVLTMGNQFNAVQAQLSNSFNMVFTVAATCGMAYFIAKQLGLQHTQVSSLDRQLAAPDPCPADRPW